MRINITKPCSEKFDSFKPTPEGGFCSSCQKEVTDFTKMTDDEVIAYFRNRHEKVCGRFKESQLKVYQKSSYSRKGSVNFFGVGIMSVTLLSLLPNNIEAQQLEEMVKIPIEQKDGQTKDSTTTLTENLVSGIVVDESGEPFPFVNVVVYQNGNFISGISTDMEGKFELPMPLRTKSVLEFSCIGYIMQKIVIEKDSSPRDLTIEMTGGGDIHIMGEALIDELYSSKYSLWQKAKAIFR